MARCGMVWQGKEIMRFDYRHPTYLQARVGAMARSGGKCQLCGVNAATEGHHWRFPNYLGSIPGGGRIVR